jgi:DNA mismatch endonuclease Vsr
MAPHPNDNWLVVPDATSFRSAACPKRGLREAGRRVSMREPAADRTRACLPSSNRMRLQRERDTRPERAVRSELFRLGLRYRVHRRPLPGLRREADIVFAGSRVAVFVHGCFWHGCPSHASLARTNMAFWSDKIATNRRRDDPRAVAFS